MVIAGAMRAWAASVATCACALAMWVSAMHILNGSTQYLLHNAVDVSAGFGAVFAVTAAVVYIPTFSVIEWLRAKDFTRRQAVGLGVALAPIAYLAVTLRFRETGDPETAIGWLAYWASHLPGLIIGTLPFAVAGATFGWLWFRKRDRTENDAAAR